jgi:hypothetical protein
MIGEEDNGEDEQLLTMMSTEELQSVLRKRNKEKQEVERQFVDLKAKVKGLLESQTRRKKSPGSMTFRQSLTRVWERGTWMRRG